MPENDNEGISIAPYARKVGHEVELSSAGSPGLARWLDDQGYGTPVPSHGYGCGCEQADQYLIHSTQDCTAPGGEYLIGGSSGVLFGSAEYLQATAALANGIKANRCTISDRQGMHTHVDAPRNGPTQVDRVAKVRVIRIYKRFEGEILTLAAGPFSEVRNNGCTYNDMPYNVFYRGSAAEFWSHSTEEVEPNVTLPGRPYPLNFESNKGTIEWRVWNAVRSQWRMIVAGAVSSAVVEAAVEGRDSVPGDSKTFEGFLAGLLDPSVLALIGRQRMTQGRSDQE